MSKRPRKTGFWGFLPDGIYYSLLGIQNRIWYVPKTFEDGYEYRFFADQAFPLALMAVVVPFTLFALLAAILPAAGVQVPAVEVSATAGVLLTLSPVLAYLGILAIGLRTGFLFSRIEYSWGDEAHDTVAWKRTGPRGNVIASGVSVVGKRGFRHPEELVGMSFGG